MTRQLSRAARVSDSDFDLRRENAPPAPVVRSTIRNEKLGSIDTLSAAFIHFYFEPTDTYFKALIKAIDGFIAAVREEARSCGHADTEAARRVSDTTRDCLANVSIEPRRRELERRLTVLYYLGSNDLVGLAAKLRSTSESA